VRLLSGLSLACLLAIAAVHAADPLVGVWQFNPESSLPTKLLKSERLEVSSVGPGYRFVYRIVLSNGANIGYSFVSHLKGEETKLVAADGNVFGAVRLTRRGAARFMIDVVTDAGRHEEYRVRPDGRTMTVRQTAVAGLDNLMVFDRVR